MAGRLVGEGRQLFLYWAYHPDADAPYDEALTEPVFRARAAEVERLELFMHTVTDLSPLADFHNLRELVVTLQTIPRVVGLHNARRLERLTITEVKLEQIPNLRACGALLHLDLSRNRLRRIEGLEGLVELESLWLNENHIERIERLSSNLRLRSLWLARNRIHSAGEELEAQPALQELNLAANRIGSFREIPAFGRLRSLQALTLTDPHYGPNPVCALCNYATYTLYCVPALLSLDGTTVSAEVRALAEATFFKKKMYYNMRIKTVKRHVSSGLSAAACAKRARAAALQLNLNVLLRQQADVRAAIAERTGLAPRLQSAAALERLPAAALDPHLGAKQRALGRAIGGKLSQLEQLERSHAQLLSAAGAARDGAIARLLVELDTGGNVRFEDGSPRDVWYSSCVDLVHSRFFPKDFEAAGVAGLRVTRVTRVHNRHLRACFEAALEAIVDPSDGTYKRSLEYLFTSAAGAPPGFSAHRESLAAAAAAGGGGGGGARAPPGAPPLILGADATENAQRDAETLRIAEVGFRAAARDRDLRGDRDLARRGADGAAVGFDADDRMSADEGGGAEEEDGEEEGGSAAAAAAAAAAPPPRPADDDASDDDADPLDVVSSGRARRARRRARRRAAEQAGAGAGAGAGGAGSTSAAWAFTNSISLADLPRLQAAAAKAAGGDAAAAGGGSAAPGGPARAGAGALALESAGVLRGQLLICKVFLGKCAPEDASRTAARDGAVVSADYPSHHSAFRQARPDDGRQREWFLFDPALALTEYVVEFEYAAAASGGGGAGEAVALPARLVDAGPGMSAAEVGALARPLADFVRKCGPGAAAALHAADAGGGGGGGADAEAPSPTYDAECAAALALPPALPQRARFSRLGEDTVRAAAAAVAAAARDDAAAGALAANGGGGGGGGAAGGGWGHLGLHGHGVRVIDGLALPECRSLTSLDLSFNEIESMRGLEELHSLLHLDLSFNLIKRVEGLTACARLQELLLHNNLLYRLEDAAVLRACCGGTLHRLSLRANALAETRGYRLTVLSRLPALTELDGAAVSADERQLLLAAGADAGGLLTITPTLLQAHSYLRNPPSLPNSSYSGTARPRTVAELLSQGVALTAAPARAGGDAGGGAGGAAPSGARLSAGLPTGPAAAAEPDGRVGGAIGGSGGGANAATAGSEWERAVEHLLLDGLGLKRVHGLDSLVHLRVLSLAGNELTRIEGLECCAGLEELNLEDNRVSRLDGLGALRCLRKLEAGKNRLTSLEGLAPLESMTQVSVEDNQIATLAGVEQLVGLMELYAGNNAIAALREAHRLKGLPKLIILDVSGNPLCGDSEYRLYALYLLRRLKVLDGAAVDSHEQSVAKERFAGKLTHELIVARAGPPAAGAPGAGAAWPHLHVLDLSAAKLREVSLVGAEAFPGIAELNLAGNQLSELGSLQPLPTLLVLNLSSNALTAGGGPTAPSTPAGAAAAAHGGGGGGGGARAPGAPPDGGGFARPLASLRHVSPVLERLDLTANQIADLHALPLAQLPSLHSLRLGGNEIARLPARIFSAQAKLRELSLERNRIRVLEAECFAGLERLAELRLDENQLRTLEPPSPLPCLEVLSLSANRIVDVSELEKLASLGGLLRLSAAGNPVARKQLYRPTLVKRLSSVEVIDGRPITPDERERVELVFGGEARAGLNPGATVVGLGGAGGGAGGGPTLSKVGLKLAAVSLDMAGGGGGGGSSAPCAPPLAPTAAGATLGCGMGGALQNVGLVGVGIGHSNAGLRASDPGPAFGPGAGSGATQWDLGQHGGAPSAPPAGPPMLGRGGRVRSTNELHSGAQAAGLIRKGSTTMRPSSHSRRMTFSGPGGGATASGPNQKPALRHVSSGTLPEVAALPSVEQHHTGAALYGHQPATSGAAPLRRNATGGF